jgi:hypothetical protein
MPRFFRAIAFLPRSEAVFTDHRGNRNLDPLLTGPLMIGAIAARGRSLTQGAHDALTRTQFCFAEACFVLVSRILQDPHTVGRSQGNCSSGASISMFGFTSDKPRFEWDITVAETAATWS